MIRPAITNEVQVSKLKKKQAYILELLATTLAFVSVFIFFVKILFF